jgi:hypothetical protein
MKRSMNVEGVPYYPFMIRFVVDGRRHRAKRWAPAAYYLASEIAGLAERFPGKQLRVTSVVSV